MGFEPTTPTLARLCSTPELHPHPKRGYAAQASVNSAASPPMPKPARHCNRWTRDVRRGVPGRGGRARFCCTRAILANAYRQWLMAPARSNLANVVPFPRPRPFRGAAARDDGARTSGNAALLGVAVLVVIGGVFLVEGITSIPRHIDCNFSKHRPCHSFVDAN